MTEVILYLSWDQSSTLCYNKIVPCCNAHTFNNFTKHTHTLCIDPLCYLHYKFAEIQQRISELFVEAAGQYILAYEGPDGFESNKTPAGPDHASDSVAHYLNYRKTSIYGGSNEIQKNIIAKAILGV